MRKTIVLGIASVLLGSILFANNNDFLADNVSYESNGQAAFVPYDGVTPPIDPEHPDPNHPVGPMNPDGTKPDPGTNGPLSIDFTSSLDFGVHPISNKDQIYHAKAQRYFDDTKVSPNYIQLTDSRGTNAGWVLKVEELGQFKETKAGQYPELRGAKLSFKNPIADSYSEGIKPATSEALDLIPGQEAVIASAEPGSGAGTWEIHWGERKDLQQEANSEDLVNPDVQLFVPGSTPKDAASYTTKLLWVISELPNN